MEKKTPPPFDYELAKQKVKVPCRMSLYISANYFYCSEFTRNLETELKQWFVSSEFSGFQRS